MRTYCIVVDALFLRSCLSSVMGCADHMTGNRYIIVWFVGFVLSVSKKLTRKLTSANYSQAAMREL